MKPKATTYTAEMDRHLLLYKAMVDPMWLGREVMRYDRLTDDYHKPMMEVMWDRDMRRPLFRAAIAEQQEAGLLPPIFLEEVDRRIRASGLYYKEELEEHPRDHYKTTMFIIRSTKIKSNERAFICDNVPF